MAVVVEAALGQEADLEAVFGGDLAQVEIHLEPGEGDRLEGEVGGGPVRRGGGGIAGERGELGQQRVPRLGHASVARLRRLHQLGQHVAGAGDDMQHLVVDGEPGRADQVEHGLVLVGEAHEIGEREGPGRALDRMHGAEDRVHRLGVGVVLGEVGEPLLQRIQQVLAFGEERLPQAVHAHLRRPR